MGKIIKEKKSSKLIKNIVDKELQKIPGQTGTMFFYQPEEPKNFKDYLDAKKNC